MHGLISKNCARVSCPEVQHFDYTSVLNSWNTVRRGVDWVSFLMDSTADVLTRMSHTGVTYRGLRHGYVIMKLIVETPENRSRQVSRSCHLHRASYLKYIIIHAGVANNVNSRYSFVLQITL